jgi:hypothetical protein
MSIAGDFRSLKNLTAQQMRRDIANRSIIDEFILDDLD